MDMYCMSIDEPLQHENLINFIIWKWKFMQFKFSLKTFSQLYLGCNYIDLLVVNNALTQIHFNGTNFINAQLTQRAFSVWPWPDQ